MLGHFDFHQRLRQGPYPFSQEIHVVAQLGLAQQVIECHAKRIGHRSVLPRARLMLLPDENHLMAGSVNRPQFPTLYWTLSERVAGILSV